MFGSDDILADDWEGPLLPHKPKVDDEKNPERSDLMT